MLRNAIGMVLGLGAMIALTASYGPQWSEQLHTVAGTRAVAAAESAPAAPVKTAPQAAVRSTGPGVNSEAAAVANPPQPAPVPAGAAAASEPVMDTAAQTGDDVALHWRAFRRHGELTQATGDFPWRNCFRRTAAARDLPETLLLAVARGESGFDATARSDRDAIGVMQIRWPLTARHLGITRERQLYDPCTNIDAGARYLRELIDQYGGDYHLAIAAYNFGPARVAVGRVPALAVAYSRYIYDHLQVVLGESPVPSGHGAAPGAGDSGRMLLLRFNRDRHARAFVQYLSETLPGLELETGARDRGDHGVYLAYASETERRQALDLIDDSGVLDAVAKTAKQTEQSYDF